MSIKEPILKCLMERIRNQSENGAVFRSVLEHRRWLLGGADGPGLFGDPRSALALAIPGPDDRAPHHPGVRIGAREAGEIRERLRELLFGKDPSLVVGGNAREQLFFECPDPTNPLCGY